MKKYIIFCEERGIVYFNDMDYYTDYNSMVNTTKDVKEAKKFNFKFQAKKMLKTIKDYSSSNFKIKKI